MILSKIFDQNEVHVHVVHGDVTTRRGVMPNNIVNNVNAFIKEHMNKYRFRKTDMLQVVHLIDTDGAYVSADAVLEDSSILKTLYKHDRIIANNKQRIVDRNKQKSCNMNRLSLERRISGIPYLAIYMSCNLDHVLYNKPNSNNSDKRIDSIAFAKKYRNDPDSFIAFITESEFSVAGNRKETWEYIKQGLNSLNRHTNMGLCFPMVDR